VDDFCSRVCVSSCAFVFLSVHLPDGVKRPGVSKRRGVASYQNEGDNLMISHSVSRLPQNYGSRLFLFFENWTGAGQEGQNLLY